jgi:hypothetical protein
MASNKAGLEFLREAAVLGLMDATLTLFRDEDPTPEEELSLARRFLETLDFLSERGSKDG